jgi:hypothetical protein
VLPTADTVRVVIVGTEVALMSSVLVAVALFRLVMVPELARFTRPLALFVMPAIVPDPFRLSVPVFVKLARAVEIAPAPVMVTVPELDKAVIELVPPMLSPPVALLVRVPAPESAVPTVNVPLFVRVPVTAMLPMTIAFVPPTDFASPESVCTPVLAV